MDQTKLNAILFALKLDASPTLCQALTMAYTEGRLDGAMAVAKDFVAKSQAAAPAAPDRRSERLDRFASDLDEAKVAHPEVKFDKPVKIGATYYRITGYNRRAPKQAFIVTGPQGGVYKCPLETVLRGQQHTHAFTS